LEECAVIEAKKSSGGKCTETQIEKLSKKESYRTDLNADLSYLDIFLKSHVEPVAIVVAPQEEVEEANQEQPEEPQVEPTPAAEEEETKEEKTQPEPEPHHRESVEIAHNNEQQLSE
jgi:hypothetical protein